MYIENKLTENKKIKNITLCCNMLNSYIAFLLDNSLCNLEFDYEFKILDSSLKHLNHMSYS